MLALNHSCLQCLIGFPNRPNQKVINVQSWNRSNFRAILGDPNFGTTKHPIYPINVSVLESSVSGESYHIYFVCSFMESRWWILAKHEPYLVNFDSWYGTFMLEYLLVEWTDFRSVCWFELSLSRTWIPVNSVLFLSAVFEKLARTHTSIFTYSCPVLLLYLHVRPLKLAHLDSIISSLDSFDNADCGYI